MAIEFWKDYGYKLYLGDDEYATAIKDDEVRVEQFKDGYSVSFLWEPIDELDSINAKRVRALAKKLDYFKEILDMAKYLNFSYEAEVPFLSHGYIVGRIDLDDYTLSVASFDDEDAVREYSLVDFDKYTFDDYRCLLSEISEYYHSFDWDDDKDEPTQSEEDRQMMNFLCHGKIKVGDDVIPCDDDKYVCKYDDKCVCKHIEDDFDDEPAFDFDVRLVNLRLTWFGFFQAQVRVLIPDEDFSEIVAEVVYDAEEGDLLIAYREGQDTVDLLSELYEVDEEDEEELLASFRAAVYDQLEAEIDDENYEV